VKRVVLVREVEAPEHAAIKEPIKEIKVDVTFDPGNPTASSLTYIPSSTQGRRITGVHGRKVASDLPDPVGRAAEWDSVGAQQNRLTVCRLWKSTSILSKCSEVSDWVSGSSESRQLQ
jgi:hypothetical protein